MAVGLGTRERIARRAAQEVRPGMVVNLGIGIPTLVADFLPPGMPVFLQAENGVVGYGSSPPPGAEDPYLVNAGGYPITLMPGAAFCDSAVAFAMIRRGRVDMTILGGLQVSQRGDLANWLVPGRRIHGYGGAMELAQKAKRVVVVMTHVSPSGEPKIVPECTYPLTARGVVDVIVTDMAVIDVTSEGLVLREVAAPYTVADVVAATGAPLLVPDQVGTY